jgi:NhaP-type Na+/H+ or K+/H+ antiporter
MFEFNAYHILLVAMGLGITAAYWLPRFVSGREPAASALLILAGLLTFGFIPGMPNALDPVDSPTVWERVSELAVIISLFATGLRIDRLVTRERWLPTLRMLVVAMPVTIAAVALLGWAMAGLSIASALLLGAALAPTDPVLAGDVQVGKPLEGGEHPVRFTLTAEAGLNDGLAFPFVYFALLAAERGVAPGEWGLEWLLRDVVYRIAVGAAAGAAVGWLLGKIMFEWPRENSLAKTESGVVAFAGVFVAYGVTELAEGYGFIACFVAGIVVRHTEARHEFHRRLHSFTETIEHALTAVILVALGGALPSLWPAFDWRHAVVGLALILVIRPLSGWFALAGTGLRKRERGVVAVYGVRGIGSIYYLAYAGSHAHFADEAAVWATAAFTILASTIIHGLTAGLAVERATGEVQLSPPGTDREVRSSA